MAASLPPLRLLHFNDVYEIAARSKEPVGGATRFSTLIKRYFEGTEEGGSPLVLFSGDALNPSIISTITKGKHMCAVLNELKVSATVIGNHDLDCGFDTLHRFLPFCKFPWLLANVLNEQGEPMSAIAGTHIIDHRLTPTQTVKVGLIGLVEEEWMAAIRTLPDGYRCQDAATIGAPLVRQLKEQGCVIVICLAHMRWPRLESLAAAVPDLDLILGGHDHFYQQGVVNNVPVVVSGTEFRHLTELTIDLSAFPVDSSDEQRGRRAAAVSMKQIDVTSDIPEDPVMQEVIKEYTDIVAKKMDKEIGYISAELDARSAMVRTREMPIGNFLCDVARRAVGADCCILNSGTIRSDSVYPAGPITLRELTQILPFPTDTIVCLRLTGQKLLDALENGFSQFPATEGRFPQISGIRLTFDPSKPAFSRVVAVEIGGEPLDRNRLYTLATKPFLAQGLDGYVSLKDNEMLVDEEMAVMLPLLVRHTLLKLKFLNILQWKERLKNPFLTKPFRIKPVVDGRMQMLNAEQALPDLNQTR